jgi:hypothetical protein
VGEGLAYSYEWGGFVGTKKKDERRPLSINSSMGHRIHFYVDLEPCVYKKMDHGYILKLFNPALCKKIYNYLRFLFHYLSI